MLTMVRSMITRVLLCITGSIAAFKTIELAMMLTSSGYEVKIIMSSCANRFIGYDTLNGLFPGAVFQSSENNNFDETNRILHISLAEDADLVLIAPATANIIAKIAGGFADCLISQVCLATKAKILLVPAMNVNMWHNSFTQNNISTLEKNGVTICGPGYGKQACGAVGLGTMLEAFEIVSELRRLASNIKSLQGKRVLITAGATQEHIDPIRYISNFSSGKMGFAIAEVAWELGAEVTLISGPTSLNKPYGIQLSSIITAEEMLDVCISEIDSKGADIFISCAAVSDYKPNKRASQKIKKTQDPLILELSRNPEIVTHIKDNYPQIFCVGFAAETENAEEYGIAKLVNKHLDLIAINNILSNNVLGSDCNELIVIDKKMQKWKIDYSPKRQVAKELLQIIANHIGQ